MSEDLNINDEMNKEQQQEPMVDDPTQGVEPAIEVNDALEPAGEEPPEVIEEPVVEELKEEPEQVEEPKEEVSVEPEQSKDESEQQEESKEEEKPAEEPVEEPKEEPEEQEENKEEEKKPEDEKPEEEPEAQEDIEAIKKELEELKAERQEENQIKEFTEKRDNSINEYNDMCNRLANALQGEFEKYGIDINKTMDELVKEDPAKAEIAKGLIQQAERIQNEQKAKINNDLNTAFTDIVFTKAARMMEKFDLTEEQQVVVAETFLNIMQNSGIKDLADDLAAKVELAVARAKMVVPKVIDAVKETKEAVDAIKEVVEVVKEEPIKVEVELKEEAPAEPEIPAEPEQPKVEPVAVEDFEEGVADKTVSAPAADIDETNVLQKLAALPHKERVAFYTKHYDLITRASLIAAREHEQRLRNGEVI